MFNIFKYQVDKIFYVAPIRYGFLDKVYTFTRIFYFKQNLALYPVELILLVLFNYLYIFFINFKNL